MTNGRTTKLYTQLEIEEHKPTKIRGWCHLPWMYL